MNDIIWLRRETIHWVGWRRQSNSKWAKWPPLEFTGNYKLKLTSEGWHTPTSKLITVTIKLQNGGRWLICFRHAIVQTRVTTIVLLSHKLVANVLQHYELLCTLPPKRNTFFFIPWQLYSQGTEPEVVLSLKFIAVPGHALIPKANFIFLHLLIIEYMVVTKRLTR